MTSAVSTVSLAALGFALGAAAMLSELPNSFFKRQLDIAPGAPGGGPAMLFFYVVDQVDFLLGAWLVAWLWVPPHAASRPLVNSLRARGSSGHQRPGGPPRHAGFGQIIA